MRTFTALFATLAMLSGAHPALAAKKLGPPSAAAKEPQNRIAVVRAVKTLEEPGRILFKRVLELRGETPRKLAVRAGADTVARAEIGASYIVVYTTLHRTLRKEYFEDPRGPRIVGLPTVGEALFEDSAPLRALLGPGSGGEPLADREILDAILAQVERPDPAGRRLVLAELALRPGLAESAGEADLEVLRRALAGGGLEPAAQEYLLRAVEPLAGGPAGEWIAGATRDIVAAHGAELDLASAVPSLLRIAIQTLATAGQRGDAGLLARHLDSNNPGVGRAALQAMRSLDPAVAAEEAARAVARGDLHPDTRREIERFLEEARPADWPQFRGPDRHGTVGKTGLLASWGEGQPRVLWRRALGGGFSAVSAAGGRLYTMSLDGDQEVALCLDASSGETIWQVAVGETGEAFPEGGPRSTPTVVDGVVYTASSQGRLLALSATDGSLLWARELGGSGPVPRFGYSISPLVDGDRVIIETGEPDQEPGVIALDRATGEPLWQALEGPAGYSTPIAVEIAGVRQYVFFRRAAAEVVALSTEGEILWRHPTSGLAIIVSPIFLPPDRIFVATSDDAMGGLMLRVTRDEEGFRAEEAWSERLMRNHFNSSVLVDGHLYGFDNATLRCVDAASGERRWAKRGLGKGSLIAAGDLLFVLGDAGELALVRATPDGYHEAGRIAVTKGRSWTAPSLAGGRLYVRDSDELVSLDVRVAPGPGATSPAAASVAEAPGAAPAAPGLDLAGVLERYEEARGGRERWRRAGSLRMTGTYAAFSENSAFELLRRRGDHYRLGFEMLGGSTIRARDAEGPWGLHPLLFPETTRVDEDPYKTQFERESLFEPPLIDPAGKGVEVKLLGPGEIDRKPTIDLELTLPGGSLETWHLSPESFLEIAVDSTIHDYTQSSEPMRQRAFYADFREVGGLVLPFQLDLEFGARLETMRVEEAVLDSDLDPARFSPPK